MIFIGTRNFDIMTRNAITLPDNPFVAFPNHKGFDEMNSAILQRFPARIVALRLFESPPHSQTKHGGTEMV